MKKVLMPLLLMAFAISSFSQRSIEGNWLGTLNVGGGGLRIVFHIAKNGSGYTSKMDSPDQGAKDIPGIVSHCEWR